jgi:hypothetical protein
MKLPRSRSIRTLALPLAFAAIFAVTSAGTASADGGWGKIYSLAHTPGDCLAEEGLPMTDGCWNANIQQWQYQLDSGYIVSGNDYRCLSVQAGASGQNGSPIDMEPCGNGSWQTWQVTGQSLYNPQSGRCLDDTDGTFWIQLQLWDCNIGGNANQNWYIDPSAYV